MSELISGKEALIAWYEGLEIEVKHSTTGWFVFNDHNFGITVFKSEVHQFRLKPRTITVNGIEVPCNKSKHDKDDVVWVISTACENWYDWFMVQIVTPILFTGKQKKKLNKLLQHYVLCLR